MEWEPALRVSPLHERIVFWGKPTTPGESRLDTYDDVEPDDRRHHCKTEREVVPKTQMSMECLAAIHGIGEGSICCSSIDTVVRRARVWC